MHVEQGAKLELGMRTMSSSRRLRLVGRRGGFGLVAGAPLGAFAEEHPILLRQLGLQPLQLELQRFTILALGNRQLLSELDDTCRQPPILGLEEQRRPAQHLGILLAPEVDAHVEVLSSRRVADARHGGQ